MQSLLCKSKAIDNLLNIGSLLLVLWVWMFWTLECYYSSITVVLVCSRCEWSSCFLTQNMQCDLTFFFFFFETLYFWRFLSLLKSNQTNQTLRELKKWYKNVLPYMRRAILCYVFSLCLTYQCHGTWTGSSSGCCWRENPESHVWSEWISNILVQNSVTPVPENDTRTPLETHRKCGEFSWMIGY